MILTQADTQMLLWQQNMHGGYVGAVAVIWIFLFFFCVMPNCFLVVKRVLESKPQLASKIEWLY